MDAARALGQTPIGYDGGPGAPVGSPTYTVGDGEAGRVGVDSAGGRGVGGGRGAAPPAPGAGGATAAAGGATGNPAGNADAAAGKPAEPDSAGPEGLTPRDQEILTFERHWWRYAGAKEQAIRTAFEVSATRYYQLLNMLIDKPAALVADPMLVRRLRRLRADRRRARAGRPRPSGI